MVAVTVTGDTVSVADESDSGSEEEELDDPVTCGCNEHFGMHISTVYIFTHTHTHTHIYIYIYIYI